MTFEFVANMGGCTVAHTRLTNIVLEVDAPDLSDKWRLFYYTYYTSGPQQGEWGTV